jgi:four helix bundle protein
VAIQSYRDLKVWQEAMDLVVESYRLAKLLPRDEAYGLMSQIRRAAVSLPANIAEGHGRDHLGDYLHHLSVTNGSLVELETHLLIAKRLGYFTDGELDNAFKLTSELGRMLSGLKRGLRRVDHPRKIADT